MKFKIYSKSSKSNDVIMKFESASHTTAIDYASQIKNIDRKSFMELFDVKQIVEKKVINYGILPEKK
jgi:hypothetical protein|tara:strand:- start:224 stop:424 length:201 start_codon:yes stop_codon:yes gene_type:complete